MHIFIVAILVSFLIPIEVADAGRPCNSISSVRSCERAGTRQRRTKPQIGIELFNPSNANDDGVIRFNGVAKGGYVQEHRNAMGRLLRQRIHIHFGPRAQCYSSCTQILAHHFADIVCWEETTRFFFHQGTDVNGNKSMRSTILLVAGFESGLRSLLAERGFTEMTATPDSISVSGADIAEALGRGICP